MVRNALVVGCGAVGSTYDEGKESDVALTHAAGYEMHERTRLIAGVDTDPDRREPFRTFRDVPAYETVEMAARNHDVDLVSVCVPTTSHAALVERALDLDPDGILCEKPLAGDADAARRIVDRCRSTGVALSVNYTRRYLPGCRVAREMLRGGFIGVPLRAVLVYNKGFLNNGSHVVDLMRWWFGEADNVVVADGTQPDALIDLEDARCHVVHAGNHEYNHVQADVYGTNGRIQLLKQGGRLRWERVETSPLFEVAQRLGERQELNTGFRWMGYFAVDDLVTAVDGSMSPACDGEEALRTLELCERIMGESGSSNDS